MAYIPVAELIKLCQDIDQQEADCRLIETRLRRIRMSLREAIPSNRWSECGWDPNKEREEVEAVAEGR